MRIFSKKSVLLEYLGKDKKDTKYIDRAILKGDIVVCDGFYLIKNEVLRFGFELLMNENKELKELSKNAEEYKANAEYYESENKELKEKNEVLDTVIENLRDKGIDISLGIE